MTMYTGLFASCEVSDNSDLSEPSVRSVFMPSVVSTDTDVLYHPRLSCAITGGTLVFDASEYNWVPTAVFIRNLDATNYVTVTTETDAGTVSLRLAAGKMCMLPALKSTKDLTIVANVAVCDCKVMIVGA